MSLYDKSAFSINNGVVEREDFLAYTSGGNIIDEPVCLFEMLYGQRGTLSLCNYSTSLRFYRSYLSFPRKNWNIRGEDLLRYLRLETDALLLLSAWDVVLFKVLSPCLGSKSA